ncbi:MAG: slipin family protein [Acholeplasmataceae bacterium]|nr:slipin family protein [Acholeplasmataceae bacterium]
MFTIVKEYESGVKFRFGKFVKVLKPGIRFVFPIVHEYKKIDLRTITQDVPEQKCITKDNVTITINAVVYYRVFDAKIAVLDVKDCFFAVTQLAQTTLRNSLGGFKLDELLSNLKVISREIKEIVDTETDPWGIKVEKVEIKDIKIPADMERIIAKEAEAEREKRAIIVKSEGEVEASQKLADAARILSSSPGAMHLRTLATLNDLSGDKSNTIVLAIPVEVLESFKNTNVVDKVKSLVTK